MVHQFRHRQSLFRIFMETALYKILGFIGQWNSLWKIDIFIDYFYQIIFSPNLEGDSPENELIGKNSWYIIRCTNVPNVNFVVVLLFLNHFWGTIKWSSAPGFSEQRRVNGPTEVANFYYILNSIDLTSWKRMFSGFISRWIISLSCINSMAWQTCLITFFTFSYVNLPYVFKLL
jgi:hypothetical protein